MIYLDNAATTMVKPKEVIEAVVSAMNSLGNAERGIHKATLGASRLVFSARKLIAEFFNAESHTEIVFTMNATESLNIAIRGILEPEDEVISTVMEHNSVLRPLYELEKNGVGLCLIGTDKYGRLQYDEIEKYITKRTKAIVCTAASNLTGNCVNLERVGKIARDNNLIFVVDASQMAGIYPIDVKKLGIDILCFTGHKGLLGPQGTGGIYVRSGVDVRPLLVGGTGIHTYSKSQPERMPTRLEAGTLNGHGIAGLKSGIEYINKNGIDKLREIELAHMWKFYNGIKEISGIKLYGDFSTKRRCPIVSINIGEYDSSQVVDELFERFEIATRGGGHCAPLMHEALGTREQGAVRFSFSHFNTDKEVDVAIRAVRQLAEE